MIVIVLALVILFSALRPRTGVRYSPAYLMGPNMEGLLPNTCMRAVVGSNCWFKAVGAECQNWMGKCSRRPDGACFCGYTSAVVNA